MGEYLKFSDVEIEEKKFQYSIKIINIGKGDMKKKIISHEFA